MNGQSLIYIGGGLSLLWGIAHLIPTRSVVRGFGDISEDNQRIISMEWIMEGVTLIFLGLTVITITALDPTGTASTVIYLLTSMCLIIMAFISLLTGFKVHFLPFRLCPVIFSLSAVLVVIGWTMIRA